MLNLKPATDTLTRLVIDVRDDQLDAPTPCEQTTVGALLDHIDGLSLAFSAAAEKTSPDGGGQPPSADATRLGADWRSRIPERLAALARAWRAEAAWRGMTSVGGVDLPGDAAGVVALDEVIVHGWDLASATGQPFTGEPALLAAVHGFVRSSVAQQPEGSPGLFGPPVQVPEGAPLLDRIIGLTGRDPGWRPPGR